VKRRGAGLVELLVAMSILGVMGTIWMRASVTNERVSREQVRRERSAIATDEALRVIGASLGQIARDEPLRLLGDTALEWAAPVARGVACAVHPDSVSVLIDHPGVWWDVLPDSADRLVIDHGAGARSEHIVLEVRSRQSTVGCVGASRLLRVAPLIGAPATGPPLINVTRRVRLVVYRGGDGAWWLGERRCAASLNASCGAVQPVAGPLASPRGGLVITESFGMVRVDASGPDGARRWVATRLP
jgi:hypothetical protein